ncbi:MAG: hypothetical protein U1F08_06090 [Steroidobacteraceae bacterium]
MNLTLRDRSLRLRVTPGEFAALRGGATLQLSPSHAGRAILSLELACGPSLGFFVDATCWRLVLPAADLDGFAATLPRRDGLHYDLGDGLVLEFEVDVRSR